MILLHLYGDYKKHKPLHTRSLTASLPLKYDGCRTILSFWDGNLSGAMLNFGGLSIFTYGGIKIKLDANIAFDAFRKLFRRFQP